MSLSRASNDHDPILLVEDDDAIALVVETAMAREGYVLHRAANLAERNRALGETRYRLMITDVILPDGNGLNELAALRSHHDIASVIVLSAQNTLNTAIRAAEQGAFEYLPKPFDLNELVRVVASALARPATESAALPEPVEPDAMPLIGRATAMQAVYRTIAKLASNDLSVLVLGESGTGKELVAQAIHETGRRAGGPFVAVNMAAIPRDLIEAELFGHEKGAFTGAHARATGRIEQATGGTLCLDEIGDMPMEAQTRLLRVLQSGEFVPVGGARPIKADIRIVAATNQDLPDLVRQNRFREDLYYRLNVIPIALPPLRDRREDIPALVDHFIRLSVVEGLAAKAFEPGALDALVRHDWPGNVRELKNIVQRLLVLARDPRITARDVSALLPDGNAANVREQTNVIPISFSDAVWARGEASLLDTAYYGKLYDHLLEEVERPLITLLLNHHHGNQLRVAEHLGINRNTLRKKMQQLGLK